MAMSSDIERRRKRSSWFLTHTLAVLTLITVLMLAGLSVLWLREGQAAFEIPLPVRVLGGIGTVAMLWLWIRMLVAYFRERPPHYSVFWGFFLMLGSYIAALFYFWFVWRSRHRPNPRDHARVS